MDILLCYFPWCGISIHREIPFHEIHSYNTSTLLPQPSHSILPVTIFCIIHFSVGDRKEKKFVNIFTTRKRCLGQGNVFTPVCLFPEGRGDLHRGGLPPGGLLPRGSASREREGVHPGGVGRTRKEGDTHPTGIL